MLQSIFNVSCEHSLLAGILFQLELLHLHFKLFVEVLSIASTRFSSEMQNLVLPITFLRSFMYSFSFLFLFLMCEGFLARALYAVKRETAAAILIQKHVRRWLFRHSYVELYSAAVTIQSNIRGFSTRQRYVHGKKHKAATVIQVN